MSGTCVVACAYRARSRRRKNIFGVSCSSDSGEPPRSPEHHHPKVKPSSASAEACAEEDKEKVRDKYGRVKQFKRLTIFFENAGYMHQVINLQYKSADKSTTVLRSYDLLAARPGNNEKLWEQLFTKSDVDIISVPLAARMQFHPQKTWFKLAR